MKSKQTMFLKRLIDQTFDFNGVIKNIEYVIRKNEDTVHKAIAESVLQPLVNAFAAEKINTEKFRRQLADLFDSNQQLLLERLAKGCGYYRNFCIDKLRVLLRHHAEMKQNKRVKTYLNQVAELDLIFSKKIEEIDKAKLLVEAILSAEENVDTTASKALMASERTAMLEEIRAAMPEVIESKKGRKGKKKKKSAGEASGEDQRTHEISIDMLKSGMTIAQICEKRSLVPSTIEGHLAKGIESGVLEITAIASPTHVDEIGAAVDSYGKEATLSVLYQHFKGRYSYGILRAVTAHLSLINNKPQEHTI